MPRPTLALLLAACAALLAPSCASVDVIAVDVLVQPGPAMRTEAATWNARMREQEPAGFELDAQHTPHVTLLQAFVAESDLPQVLAAVAQVRSTFDVEALRMTATGLYHIPTGENGLAGIVIEPTAELHALQDAVIAAVAPFARAGGDVSAFVPDPSGAAFDPFLFEYVANFVPTQSGPKFNPHVTIGVAPRAWLETQEAQPFAPFTFGAEGLAVYQLGNYGTAARRLDRAP